MLPGADRAPLAGAETRSCWMSIAQNDARLTRRAMQLRSAARPPTHADPRASWVSCRSRSPRGAARPRRAPARPPLANSRRASRSTRRNRSRCSARPRSMRRSPRSSAQTCTPASSLLWQSGAADTAGRIRHRGADLRRGSAAAAAGSGDQRAGTRQLRPPDRVAGPKDIERLGRQLEWLRRRLLEFAPSETDFCGTCRMSLKPRWPTSARAPSC